MTGQSSPSGPPVPSEQAAELAEAFVELSNCLIEDFDVQVFLDRLVHLGVDLLGADAAALMLVGVDGLPAVVAAAADDAQLPGLFPEDSDEGPWTECLQAGRPVLVTGLPNERHRWPTFVSSALALGFHGVAAFPLRFRSDTVGVMTLFHRGSEPFGDNRCRVAQALADTALVGILQQRSVADSATLAYQLQRALDSRTVIEQAKGMLAEFGMLTLDESFLALRRYCRDRNARLTDTARRITERHLSPKAVLEGTSGASVG